MINPISFEEQDDIGELGRVSRSHSITSEEEAADRRKAAAKRPRRQSTLKKTSDVFKKPTIKRLDTSGTSKTKGSVAKKRDDKASQKAN